MKRRAESILYVSTFRDVGAELTCLSVVPRFSGLKRSWRQCCVCQSRNQIVGSVCIGACLNLVPLKGPSVLAGQRTGQTGPVLYPVRNEIQLCSEQPKNVFRSETITTYNFISAHFQDENMLQEAVTSVTNGQFHFGAPFKSGVFTTLRAGVSKLVARQVVVCDPCSMQPSAPN